MQIFRDGNFLKVARITGPTHNFLCAEVVIGSESINKIECLPLPSGKKAMLDENAVLREVQAGFLDASKRLGLCITAKRIQFLPSDSPPVEIYRFLAEALADHFAQEVPVHRQSSNE
jgi:hypothetical protein